MIKKENKESQSDKFYSYRENKKRKQKLKYYFGLYILKYVSF